MFRVMSLLIREMKPLGMEGMATFDPIAGRVHSSTSQLHLSRLVTETAAKSAHVKRKSGRLCTAVFGPHRGLHSSTSQLNLSRF